ncbi:MAG: TatD family hydrolase [Candidatus Micrarchaeota archaeon]|nr:TatD family hydrolase [Candidatus Micrarchaeota archaeon]
MNEYLFADAHCHLESIAGGLLPYILHISAGYSHDSNLKNSRIAAQHSNAYLCAGIAPQEAMKHQDIKIKLVEWEEAIATQIADTGRLVAIGEIGLDYHWAKTQEERFLQHECFISQLALAERLGLPAVIHSRDAEEEVVEILRNFNLRYMLHCFSGKAQTAMLAASHKGIISIPPLRSKERRQFIRDLPLEKLVCESDAPYIGKTPQDTLEAIKIIAEIKELPAEAVQKQTLLNTIEFFGIK